MQPADAEIAKHETLLPPQHTTPNTNPSTPPTTTKNNFVISKYITYLSNQINATNNMDTNLKKGIKPAEKLDLLTNRMSAVLLVKLSGARTWISPTLFYEHFPSIEQLKEKAGIESSIKITYGVEEYNLYPSVIHRDHNNFIDHYYAVQAHNMFGRFTPIAPDEGIIEGLNKTAYLYLQSLKSKFYTHVHLAYRANGDYQFIHVEDPLSLNAPNPFSKVGQNLIKIACKHVRNDVLLHMYTDPYNAKELKNNRSKVEVQRKLNTDNIIEQIFNNVENKIVSRVDKQLSLFKKGLMQAIEEIIDERLNIIRNIALSEVEE